jgi:hypothetical protein
MMQEVDLGMEEGMSPFDGPPLQVAERRLSTNTGMERKIRFSYLLRSTKSHSSKSTRSLMSNATSLAFLELYESHEEALADEKMERKRR